MAQPRERHNPGSRKSNRRMNLPKDKGVDARGRVRRLATNFEDASIDDWYGGGCEYQRLQDLEWVDGIGRGARERRGKQFRSGRCWSVHRDPPKPGEKKMSCPETARPGPLETYGRLHCAGSCLNPDLAPCPRSKKRLGRRWKLRRVRYYPSQTKRANLKARIYQNLVQTFDHHICLSLYESCLK